MCQGGAELPLSVVAEVMVLHVTPRALEQG